MIPVVDQAADVRDLSANIMTLLSEEERDKPENWLALSLTLIGCVPTFGSAVKGKCKVALKGGKGTSKDTLLAVLRGMGKGDLDLAASNIVNKLNDFYWTISRYGKDYAPGSKIGCGGGNIESDKKSRECCPHRLNIPNYQQTIRNKKGKIMKPINLKAGS